MWIVMVLLALLNSLACGGDPGQPAAAAAAGGAAQGLMEEVRCTSWLAATSGGSRPEQRARAVRQHPRRAYTTTN